MRCCLENSSSLYLQKNNDSINTESALDEINYESNRNGEVELYGRLALKHKLLNLLMMFGFFPQDTSSWPARSDILLAYHMDHEVGMSSSLCGRCVE